MSQDHVPYVVDDQRYRRFSECNIGFNAVSRDFGQPWYVRFSRTQDTLCRTGQASVKRPLENPEDAQIMYAICKAMGRFDVITTHWGLGHANRDWLLWDPCRDGPERDDLQPLTDSARLTGEIKHLALDSGACDVGVAAVDERWFYGDVQGHYADSEIAHHTPFLIDDADEVTEDERGFHLPRAMNHVVAILVPMDPDMILTAPSMLAEATTNHGYSTAAHVATNVAGFIRAMGYRAAASLNGTALSIPIAIDAGLGELGRNGMLITPKWGPCVRICKVFTDMPLRVATPKSLGITEYCKTCKLCAEGCPSHAVQSGEPTYVGHNECNNNGVLKWHVDAKRCLRWWVASGTSCSICMARCPFTLGRRWFGGLPQWIIQRTSAFNRLIQQITRPWVLRHQRPPAGYLHDFHA